MEIDVAEFIYRLDILGPLIGFHFDQIIYHRWRSSFLLVLLHIER